MFKGIYILSLVLSLAVVFGGPIEAFAQVEEATVQVDGLSCPFCAYGLEKKLKKVEGIEKLEIKVNEGTAKIRVREDKTLSFEAVEKAVKDGGFTPREISLTVTGRLVERDGRTVLTIPDSDQVFLVESNEQLGKIKEALNGEEKAVRLVGRLTHDHEQGHAGHPHSISIEQFKLL